MRFAVHVTNRPLPNVLGRQTRAAPYSRKSRTSQLHLLWSIHPKLAPRRPHRKRAQKSTNGGSTYQLPWGKRSAYGNLTLARKEPYNGMHYRTLYFPRAKEVFNKQNVFYSKQKKFSEQILIFSAHKLYFPHEKDVFRKKIKINKSSAGVPIGRS